MKTWLLLDVSFLAHRAFRTTGHLSHKGIKTGVIYGLLRDVVNFQDRFDTDNVAFCFDSKHSLRKEICPTYKKKRTEDDEETMKALSKLKKQIAALRKQYLKDMGYKNIFIQKGYEADDLIAEICWEYFRDKETEIIIVSADSDFFQLLSDRVSMWNPITHKMVTSDSLYEKYEVKPSAWPLVRSIAGGKDGIVGVKGVGIKTACKHVTGKSTEKVRRKISAEIDTFNLNMRLLQLPFLGTQPCKLRKDKVTKKKWEKVADYLGLKSLRNDPPIRDKILRKEYRKGKKRQKQLKLRSS